MWTKFPNIRKAALEIAYDNGMINRFEPEEKFLDACLSVLGADGVYETDLERFEAFLGELTTKEMNDLCCGEFQDMAVIVDQAPKNADGHSLAGLLEDFFNVET